MNKETIFTIVKNILAIGGAFLMGTDIFGITVNELVWNEWVGALLGIIAVIWSFVDKTSTLESFEGSFRYLITFFGTFLVTKGLISQQVFLTISAAVVALIPIIYREISKQKSLAIAKGKLAIMDLAGVKENLKKGAHVTPVVHSKKTA